MGKLASRATQLAAVVEGTAVFVFFYQALRVLFSTLFGLIYDAIFAEIVPLTTVGLLLVVVILALLAPLAAPRRPSRRRSALLVGAVVVFLARIPLTLNEPQARLAASVLIVAGTGLYLATRLREKPQKVTQVLVLALIVDQLLRAAGHTWDVTLREAWLTGQIVICVILCILAGWLFRRRPTEHTPAGIALGLSFSLFWGAWLFLETSLLNFPNVMARWYGTDYGLLNARPGDPAYFVARWGGAEYLLFALFWLFILLWPLLAEDLLRIRRRLPDGATVLVLLLVGLALGHLLTGVATYLSLAVAQPALLALLVTNLSSRKDRKTDRLGLGLSLGGILFLVLSFAYAFAFTYPYTLDLFRGMGLPIVLLAGLLAGLSALSLPAVTLPSPRLSCTRLLAICTVSSGLFLLVFLATVLPGRYQLATHEPLRFATYNIHYGFDTDWHLSLEAQARTIEASGANVVALQEVDTGRPTSYMIDDALWLAHRLGMEAVYLPTLEHLTGIALLSRYPVLDSETLLLPSELEQTGILWAELDVSGTPVNAFAIWMGLEPEERERQLDAALPFLDAHPGPAAFGGDFNSTPESPVYARLAAAGWVDPFAALGLGSPPTDPAINPRKRIDFVWLRDLTPVGAEVFDSTASDHRLVVVEAQLPD